MTLRHPSADADIADFERSDITIRGIRTALLAIGRGSPLVFLHGAGTFPGFAFARRLAAERRVIIPFHPGFGLSADDDRIGSIADHVAHYAALFDALGLETFDLAGFSLGGWIAAEYAARADSRARRLVLAAPAGLVVAEHPAPDLSRVAPHDLPGYLTHDPDVALGYFPKAPDEAFGRALGREMAAMGRLLADHPQGNPALAAQLGRIAVPTLVIWGENDRIRPAAQAGAWLRHLPSARLVSLAATGHLLFEEQPEAAVAALGGFLDELVPSPRAETSDMIPMPKGVTGKDEAFDGARWNILGQTYVLKQQSEASMAWHATLPPGTFVPPHTHPTQDEFIFVFEGRLDLWLDGADFAAAAGELVRMPKGLPHGIFNKGDQTVRCLFWVSPTRSLRGLFERIHNVADPAEVVRIAAEHEVDFLPPQG